MRFHARLLFGIASVFNFAVACALFFGRGWLVSLLHLAPIVGSNIVLANLCGAFVLLFGIAYAAVAVDPIVNRPFVPLCIVGKLFAVVSALVPFLAGAVTSTLPLMTVPDLIFAAFFIDFSRRHPAAAHGFATKP